MCSASVVPFNLRTSIPHFSNMANLPWSMTAYGSGHTKRMMFNNLCQEFVPVGFCIMHPFSLIFCELPFMQYIYSFPLFITILRLGCLKLITVNFFSAPWKSHSIFTKILFANLNLAIKVNLVLRCHSEFYTEASFPLPSVEAMWMVH